MFEMVPGCVTEAFAALDEANRHARAAEVAAVVAVAKAAELYEVDQEAVFEGMERVIFPGHAGTPGVGEFLAAEIAGILGISTGSALQRIADVLDVRFRFPRLWEAFLGGELRWWQVVDATNRAAVLGVKAVEWLDRQLAWAMKVWSWQRILKHIDRWIVEADPAVAAERAEAERRRRDVEVSGITDGHCTIWGIVDAADGVAFDHALTAVARTLPAEDGDLRQRRAAAVGVLARRVSGQDVLPAATVVVHVNATDPALGLVGPTDEAGGMSRRIGCRRGGALGCAPDRSDPRVPGRFAGDGPARRGSLGHQPRDPAPPFRFAAHGGRNPHAARRVPLRGDAVTELRPGPHHPLRRRRRSGADQVGKPRAAVEIHTPGENPRRLAPDPTRTGHLSLEFPGRIPLPGHRAGNHPHRIPAAPAPGTRTPARLGGPTPTRGGAVAGNRGLGRRGMGPRHLTGVPGCPHEAG